MPSSLHEAIVDLFRQHPPLAADLPATAITDLFDSTGTVVVAEPGPCPGEPPLLGRGAGRLVRRPGAGVLGGGRAVLGDLADPAIRPAGAARRVAEQDAVELGCGTGYVSAWLARRGARPIGIDNSARQLATARATQGEFGLWFPLIHADAERTPLRDGCADLMISEYGAAIWCDPYRWIPEAARLLRPGGRLVFMGGSPQWLLCMPREGPITDRLVRDLFGLHQVAEWDGAVEFYLPHGERIRLLRSCGLEVEDLIEVRAPADGVNDMVEEVTLEWARRWPAEEVWVARRR